MNGKLNPLPQYRGDPTLAERQEEMKKRDGITTIFKITKQTDWGFIKKIWGKIKGGD